MKLSNCDLQLNKYSKKPEVMIKRYTLINKSSRDFNVEDSNTIGSKSITVSQLTSMAEGDKVNVRVKVVDIETPKKVGKNLTKQEVIIADSTGNTVLTLWESDVNSLQLAESYYLTKLRVKIFCGDYGLSYPNFGASVSKIEDIGDVIETRSDPSESSIQGVSIVGVKDLVSFKTCISCKTKITVTEYPDTIVTCNKCNTAQNVATCSLKLMAKLLLEGPDVTIITLVAYEDMLKNLLPTGEITQEALLKLKPFNATYNAFHVITSISY